MNRAHYITSLFEYEGPATWKHKAAGVALGVAGLGAAALAGHAAAKGHSIGQSLTDVGHYISQKTQNLSVEHPHHYRYHSYRTQGA